MDNPTVNRNVNLSTGLVKRAALYIGILAFALILLLFLGAGQASAEDVTGDITSDVTWTSGSVYNITTSVTVLDGVTLEIQDNVTVVFNGSVYLFVEGTMHVNGTADHPVIFTNNASMGLAGGVIYRDGSSGSIVYANINNSNYGFNFQNVSIPCSYVNIDNTGNGLYYSFFGVEQNLAITLSDITITNTEVALYVDQDDGSLDLTLQRVITDGTYRIAWISCYNSTDNGTLNLHIIGSEFNNTFDGFWLYADIIGEVEVSDSYFMNELGTYYFFLLGYGMDTHGDMAISWDNVIMDSIGGAVWSTIDGDISVSINDVHVHNMLVFSYLVASNVDITISDSTFYNMTGGFRISADSVSSLQVTDTVFSNDPLYVTSSVLNAPFELNVDSGDVLMMFDGVTIERFDYGISCVLISGDIEFHAIDTMIDGIRYTPAIYLNCFNGSLDVTLTGVQVNDTSAVGIFYAYNIDGTATADVAINGCVFTNFWSGIEVLADIIGSAIVEDTELEGTWVSSILPPGSFGFEFIGEAPSDITTVIFDNVMVENVATAFTVEVVGDLDLTIESVVTNNTGVVGDFVAMNPENDATMMIYVANSSFSNTTTGLMFETNILDPDFSLLGTNTFNNIFGQAIMIMADLGDVVMNFDGFMMENGGGISLYLGFGNIEVNVIDSVLDGSGDGILLDLVVNSNTLDNGFITLNVMNSTLSDADYGIRTWSEELVILAMEDVTFANMDATALYFDVRSATSTDRVLSIALENVAGTNLGCGMFVYLNDGSLDLALNNTNIEAWLFGVQVEVSSVLPDDLSVIDMTVTDSVFMGGMYGIYATSLNGGTVLIDGSQFLGHSEVGFTYDSLYGLVDVEVVDSVFDGSYSEEAGNVYVLEQIEAEYILYGQPGVDDGVDWDGWDSDYSWWVDLPFVFEYNGYEYDRVFFGSNGYLNFDGSAVSIRPIGNADLEYYDDHFMAYKYADDNSSVLFNWYAYNDYSGEGESNAFQVILYATGEIQFNFAAMDGWGGSNAWGLLNDEWPYIDYNMYRVFGYDAWDADYTSYLFTPNSISPGMGARVISDMGDVDIALTNNIISNYWSGGVYVCTNDGDMVFSATENQVSYVHATDWHGYDPAVIAVEVNNGNVDATISNNTFERIWSASAIVWVESYTGGDHSFDVTGNQFVKAAYGVYTWVLVFSDQEEEVTEDSLSVVANFQDNIMTDAYGLGNYVIMLNPDTINWNVSVMQTFTGNVMDQVWYEGEYPFNYYDGGDYIPSMIEAGLIVYDWQDGTDSMLNVDLAVTVSGNEMEQAVDSDYGILVRNDIFKYHGDVESVCSVTVTDNSMYYWGNNDWYWADAIEVNSWVDGVKGVITTDTSIIVEDNNIIGELMGYSDIWGVYVSTGSYSDGDEALDVTAVAYISVVNNNIESVYCAVDLYVDYDMENTVGTWTIDVTAHIDDNQMFNVSYGVDVTMYDDVDFYANYWPYYDEVALGDHTFNYVLTVDNNVITAIYGDDDEYGIICVDVSYNSQVDPSTLFTETMVRVNGAISISGNDITQTDADASMITLYHEYDCDKTGVMEVTVDIAIDDNVLTNIGNDTSYIAIYVEEELDLDGNWNIPTDEPTVITDMSWSVTGNQIIGQFFNGILLMLDTEVDSPDCYLVQNYIADISGNTVDWAMNGGLGVAVDRSIGGSGYSELNLDVNIEDNTLMMSGLYEDELRPDESSTGLFIGEGGHPTLNDAYGEVISLDVLIAGNTICGADTGIAIGEYYEEDDDSLVDEIVWITDVNVVVENNYISDSGHAIIANGGNMTFSNNIIENCWVGIEWSGANGEVTGNTITANSGIEIYYPYHVLVQSNDVSYEDLGVGVDYWDIFYTDVQILDNVLTCYEPMGMGGWGDGIEISYSGNVLVSGNTITNSYWGVYVYGCYNLTVSDNEIIGSNGCGLEMYTVYMGWIESNVISGGGDGVFVGYECILLVIGNNTIADNEYAGIFISEDYWDDWTIHEITLYNNEITGNGVGFDYGYLDDDDLVWVVDGTCVVARNDVYFPGELEIVAGGSMSIQDVYDFEVYDDEIVVEEGGLLSASNSNLYGDNDLNVYGSLWANMCLFDGYNIYLAPTSEAEIRGGAIMFYDWAGVHVDGCSPVIADNLIFSPWGMYGVLIEGEGASPNVVSNIIALSDFGVYARGTDMGGIYDNLLLLNLKAGILAEDATGNIHDNILLANKVEILLRNSDVSVEDNEIGYTNLFQVLADYAPLLGHFVSVGEDSTEAAASDDPVAALESILGVTDIELMELVTWIKAHNGIWAEDSVVETSGNVYGMLNYALYAVRSEVHFADDVRTITVNVPHANDGVTYTYPLDIYVLNGIYASDSQVWVTGSTIEVLDDGIVLDGSEGWIEGATLMAGDYDYFLFGGSEAYNIATTYDRAKVEDSQSLNEGTWLTLTAIDDGEVASNVTIVIKDAKGEIVYEGVTDAEGKVRVLLKQYAWTSEGKDDGFNPYTINATFESGEESMELTLNESYQDATIEGQAESDMGAILAVVGVLVIILLIVAAVVVMRRRK